MPILFAASASLAIVRWALLVGATLFGAIAWAVAGDTGLAPDLLAQMPYAPAVLTGCFVTIVLAVWGLQHQPGVASNPVIGWALAETMALLGGVYLLLVGDPTFWLVGLAAQLVVSFVVMPLKA